MCRGEDCMKKFCESLVEYAMNLTDFEERKMILLKNEQQQLYKKTNFQKQL